jgi:O-methyltransferase involved in polyketide biosynthesis
MVEYKEARLADERSACRLDRVAIDLADRAAHIALFERVSRRANNVLALSEGLMTYLSEDEAGELALDLSRQRSFGKWALDLSSPGLLALAQAQMGGSWILAGLP